MKENTTMRGALEFHWDFYERAINNYSVILSALKVIDEGLDPVMEMPRIFVEQTPFDTCKIVVGANGDKREGFYSVFRGDDTRELTNIVEGHGERLSAVLYRNVNGYGAAYLYPLKQDFRRVGILALGKRADGDIDEKALKEIEMVCDVLNRFILIHSRMNLSGRTTATGVVETAIVDGFPDAILVIDGDGVVQFANNRAKEEFHKRTRYVVGERLDSVLHGVDRDFWRQGGSPEGEIKYRNAKGNKLFKVRGFELCSGEVPGAWRALVLKDSFDSRAADEEGLLKEKMTNIGLLAGGVAHDFNNLLTGILGYGSLIKNSLTHEKELFRYAEAIEHSAQRAAELTKHLLNFSRRQKRPRGLMDINVMIEDILFLIKESFRDIRIEKHLEPAMLVVKGNEADLQNVFLNLFINAKDAMEGKGELKISTEKVERGEKGFAVIHVEDTGRGIGEEIKRRIFQPYFSTKEGKENHLGMGLYLVDKVIRGHGGFIELRSERGSGARFSLFLPLSAVGVEKGAAEEKPATKGIGKGLRVLVVDDESFIRELVSGVLSRESAEVSEAASGDEGVEMFMSGQGRFDLVVLDMIMPGKKGDEVLKTIRELDPEVKVVICSGFMGAKQREKLKKLRVEGFLDKPFTDRDIVRVVSEALRKR